MIKVIKHGFARYQTQCNTCECEFEYGLEDIQRGKYVYVACPDCGEQCLHKTCDIVRKETAKEILQTLYDQCYEYNPRLPEESIGHIIPINILTLAKQYGVEIEE